MENHTRYSRTARNGTAQNKQDKNHSIQNKTGLNYTNLARVGVFVILAYLCARYLFVLLSDINTVVQIGAVDIYASLQSGLVIDLNNYRQFWWAIEFASYFCMILLSLRVFDKLIRPSRYFRRCILLLAKIKQHFMTNSYMAFVFFIVLIFSYISLQLPDIQSQEYSEWDMFFVKPYIESCSIFEIPQERALLKFYQFCLSNELFGNPKIISFAESIGILFLVYLIANKITKSNYAGLIASMFLISSSIFVNNATALGFSTEWVFFFLLSVYMVYKRPELVGVFYILSLFSKGMGFLYIPVMFYFIYKSDIPNRNKKIAMLSLAAIIPVSVFYTLFVGNHLFQTNVFIGFNFDDILVKLYNPVWNFTQEVNDSLMLNIILPLALLGLWKTRKQNSLNKVFFVFIIYLFTMQIWLPLFSDYPIGNYRMVPMVVFLVIGFVLALYQNIINRINNQTECQKQHHSFQMP